MDFVKAATRSLKSGGIEVYPKFLVKPTKDLMIRGNNFYAIWLEDEKRWTTNEYDVVSAIDNLLQEKAKEIGTSNIAYMWDADTKSIDKWHYYCTRQQFNNWVMLDSKLMFQDEEIDRDDFVTRKIPYKIEAGDCSSYEELISTLYTESERHKIEWMVGSILAGDSKNMEKIYVFYGAPGTGKSTVLDIVTMLFPGYCSAFSAKSLGDKNNQFPFEQFKDNPLIAIDRDSDLSRIDENSRLNALISHETVLVNEKFKGSYQAKFQTVLLAATNSPVKITDSRSGLLRRLIDINPSGNKIPITRFRKLKKDVEYELGAIAQHCLDVYESNPHYYDNYESREMLALSNDFYDFMITKYIDFAKKDETTLAYAYKEYVEYCTESNVIQMRKKDFKSELKSYFSEFYERFGDQWYVYKGFLKNKFENSMATVSAEKPKKEESWLKFDKDISLFDEIFKDYPAQLTTDQGTPKYKWENVKTKLKDIDTSKLHYVKVPENHIVIDFDLTDENGEKSFEKNLKAASEFPPTYAELSKSGQGIHLHYDYSGDVTKLSRFYDDKIEIKIFNGNSSLRRKVTKCNDIQVKPISCNLPLRGDTSVLQPSAVETEKHLRCLIRKCLNKEYGSTVCCIDFIAKLLNDAYNKEGFIYDVSELAPSVYSFAAQSTHQSAKCIKEYSKMKFKSKNFEETIDKTENPVDEEAPIAFFDVEVFPNLFFVSWKFADKDGKEEPFHHLFNPTPDVIKDLTKYRLIGFNNRKYDNHMLYARMMGYSEAEIYSLSDRMINAKSQRATFSQAYNLSYTDIYDFASAANKQSLKKFEIELKLHHLELGLPWDQPVDPKMWNKVAEYCDHDVYATEKVFYYLHDDWMARQMLADAAGMTVNDTTNTLTTKLIFGHDQNPQKEFNWRHMGKVPENVSHSVMTKNGTFYHDFGDPEYTMFDDKGRPIFPGYEFGPGFSTYRGEETGAGGYVFATPGIWHNVALLDIASMHPSSTIAEELFGPVYTKRLAELKQARIFIKHKEFDRLGDVLDGRLSKYIDICKKDPKMAKGLSNALKTAINSVYGLTAAGFDNKFRDPRNVDNIVAKRGALFMINLKHEVENRGFTVAHIKTDSIKIPDATPEIIEFVMNYGEMYGYDFEHEATYDRMCLVNNAVYIAKYSNDDVNGDHKGKWTATGAEFQQPYIFKKLFSKEDIDLYDMAETNSVKTCMYLDMNENNPSDHVLKFIGKVGQFCPIKPGKGGGLLVKEMTDKEGDVKYDGVTGSVGYRWLETEDIVRDHLEEFIDPTYYENAANKAVDHINQYGDFYQFVA